MGIGLSVLLLAAGAILTFAVSATVAGLLGLIWSLVLVGSRRREVIIDPRHSAAHVVAPTVVETVPEQVVRADAADDPRR